MFDLNRIVDISPYSLNKAQKYTLYHHALCDLTNHHYTHCPSYRKILDKSGFDPKGDYLIEEIPFIPVRLFKECSLVSVEPSQIIKTMTSSGTTGQSVSKIFLDRITATYQTKVLAKIVSNFIGPKRLPMLVIDTKAVIKDRNLFSARGAGILGVSMLGYDVTYALDEALQMDCEAVKAFIQRHQNETILLFGFTYMIWEYFYKHLVALNKSFDFTQAIMIHGGGWKKLSEQAVDNDTFKRLFKEANGLTRIYNYYGMVEQTGSIFMECEQGHLHSSIFSDIIIRDVNFSVLDYGKLGLVQLYSLLPFSYPGHVLLSEDLGEIIGEDDCPCGRLGKYFRIRGRVKNAEIRGCSDTQA